MRIPSLLTLALVAPMLSSCVAGETDDGDDASFDVDGKADGGISHAQAWAVIEIVNSPTIRMAQDVGLAAPLAAAITARRVGADGKPGTADDRAFTSLADLDTVPDTDSATLAALVNYANANRLIPKSSDEVAITVMSQSTFTASNIIYGALPVSETLVTFTDPDGRNFVRTTDNKGVAFAFLPKGGDLTAVPKFQERNLVDDVWTYLSLQPGARVTAMVRQSPAQTTRKAYFSFQMVDESDSHEAYLISSPCGSFRKSSSLRLGDCPTTGAGVGIMRRDATGKNTQWAYDRSSIVRNNSEGSEIVGTYQFQDTVHRPLLINSIPDGSKVDSFIARVMDRDFLVGLDSRYNTASRAYAFDVNQMDLPTLDGADLVHDVTIVRKNNPQLTQRTVVRGPLTVDTVDLAGNQLPWIAATDVSKLQTGLVQWTDTVGTTPDGVKLYLPNAMALANKNVDWHVIAPYARVKQLDGGRRELLLPRNIAGLKTFNAFSIGSISLLKTGRGYDGILAIAGKMAADWTSAKVTSEQSTVYNSKISLGTAGSNESYAGRDW